MRFQSLDDWLGWQETLHPQAIELGLARIQQVFTRLHPEPPPFTVITVAGTNGKGSTVRLLEAIFIAAGYRVAAYTSPHLLRYNERIRIEGREVEDAPICEAFQRIDTARGEISLTYFEFGTLAALDLFYRARPDIAILEVGLGGRLDAVNILDADLALITAIGLDHTEWLGPDRESIGREKAGIMRRDRPTVCSDPAPPASIVQAAREAGSTLFCLGRDYSYETSGDGWHWQGPDGEKTALPLPAQVGEHQLQNAAGVMMALGCLGERHPVSHQAVQYGLQHAQVMGRQQRRQARQRWIFDVAHNEQSVQALAALLARQEGAGKTHAIVGILRDKDIKAMLRILLPYIEAWHCVDLNVPRGTTAEQLQATLQDLSPDAKIQCYPNVTIAMEALQQTLPTSDQVVVFGSFYTVAEALQRGV